MNTSAAFCFLKEIEERREGDAPEIEEAGSSSKIVFKKSIKLKPREVELDPQLDTKRIQGNKVVMPEYVVGEKRPKLKKERRPKSNEETKTANLRLSHLDEEDEDS